MEKASEHTTPQMLVPKASSIPSQQGGNAAHDDLRRSRIKSTDAGNQTNKGAQNAKTSQYAGDDIAHACAANFVQIFPVGILRHINKGSRTLCAAVF